MSSLEECRKAEDDRRSNKPKLEKKVKTGATTLTPDKTAELAKQLQWQQHQIDALVG